MGLYLNQLPPTEVARLKAELAETLIANFCYPRFYDYRANALRMRPVDRSKRQEVWQYLNAVDFNVWGRVDVDSPDFQHQVERLFIHFVQRNRNFFGEQGRKRMIDVRSLISSCSVALAESLRKHLQGKQGNPPLGTPRPVSSWSTTTGNPEPGWERILSNTMQLQQQLQEVRGEAHLAPAPASIVGTPAPSAARPESASARRTRSIRPAANGAGSQEEALAWPPTDNRPVKSEVVRLSGAFPAQTSADAAPTLPLPLGKPENLPPASQPTRVEIPAPSSGRPKRPQPAEAAPNAPFVSSTPSGPLRQSPSLPVTTGPQSAPKVPSIIPTGTGLTVKQGEDVAVGANDEDVVIFEQMRYQLVVELRVEAVRAGIELNNQGAFQLVEALRRQDGTDVARLQVVSTLLKMCDQIITSGQASLFDYKQAMMFYLMHTRRSH